MRMRLSMQVVISFIPVVGLKYAELTTLGCSIRASSMASPATSLPAGGADYCRCDLAVPIPIVSVPCIGRQCFCF